MAKPHENAMDWSWWTPPIDLCSVCGTQTMRPRIVIGDDGSTTVYCALHLPRLLRESSADRAKNAFENFTLQHVLDHNRKPITVNSLAELRRVEKEHNVALAVACDDGGRADNPPQHELWAGDVTHGQKRVWNRDPEAYKSFDGVSTGIAADPKTDTLIDRPNATH